MQISDASFVVTDTETTGMRAGADRIVEIAAVRVCNGFVCERFSQLINPECDVPRRITRLTGISNAMVEGKPAAAEILPKYLEFLAEGTFVAHNLSFDLRFMNAELRAAALDPLPPRTLCTLRLARRLLPGLRSKSLASICEFFRIRNERAHRALADAEATAEVLLRFLEILDREHRVDTVEEVIAFQHRTYRSASRSRHLSGIRSSVLGSLPSSPGVYFMKDATGATIYIGKARDLRSRVTSYFTAIEGHPPRLRKMMDVVRDVSWQVTDSELDAMILESRLIKDQQPKFNRAQRQYHVRPFLRLSGPPFPRLEVVPLVDGDSQRYFGPFENRDVAERISGIIEAFFLLRTCSDETFSAGKPCDRAQKGRCGAPCAGFVNADAYETEVKRVERFLSGEDTDVLERVREAMRQAAVALEYEAAARWRDCLQTAESLLERDGCIALPVSDQNAVLAHLDGRADDARPLQLHLIRHGRLQQTLRLPSQLDRRHRDHLAQCLERYFHPDVNSVERLYVEESDEVRLIRQWAYTNRNQLERVPLMAQEDREATLDCVLSAITRLTGDQSAAADYGATS